MARSLSPEFRLATACAMWPPSDRRTEAIHNATARPLDWSRFFGAAHRHQIIGLVHHGLTHTRADIPTAIVRDIEKQAIALICENLEMARESLRLQSLFDDADLPVLFIKGAALAVLAFGNLGLRSGQDIDLLVPHERLPEATALILRAGYSRFDPPPDISDTKLRLIMPLRKDLGFINQSTGLRIELHWRLFLNPHAMDDSSFRTTSRVVPLSGTAGVRTLGDEDLFAYLCMHGALHWWNRLKWLADLNGLLACTPEHGIERLLQSAEARGVGRAAAQALLLCRTLLKTPLPRSLTPMLNKSAAVRWLEATALEAMTSEHDPHQVRFGTTRGSLSTILLGRGWQYKLTELRVQLTNQADVLTLPLPQSLRFLYPVLRLPLWAWRHTVKQ